MNKVFLLSFFLFLLFTSCGQGKKDIETVVSNDTIALNDTLVKKDTLEKVDTLEKEVEKEDTVSRKLTIYKRKNMELIIERDSSYKTFCYAVKNGVKRKLVFNHQYLDDCSAYFSYYSYDRYVYIVGDFEPNSNGWTCRFPLYRIDKRDLSMKFIYEGAAIHFSPNEIVVADPRLTNPDADCTAHEIWVMHDVHFNVNGKKIREDKKEYDYLRMEQKYGEDLINTKGLDR